LGTAKQNPSLAYEGIGGGLMAETSSDTEKPELKILRMSDVKSEPVDWLWKPYIPYGAISLIQGDGEMGKTTLSLAIAAAVTRGDALPVVSGVVEKYHNDYNFGGGSFAPDFRPPANVIVQNGEDSINRTIKPRLEKLGADCDRVFTIDDEDVALTYIDKRIEQTIIETEAKLVIIDPVQAFWGKANMNAANGVRPVLKQLGAVAERTGCAIILVGHLRKSGGKSIYRGLGSIDIFATARSVLTVGHANTDSNTCVMVHLKSNLAPAGPAQAFNIDPVTGFYWAGETEDDAMNGVQRTRPENKSAEAQSFIKVILYNGAVPSADILEMAAARGIAEKTLQRAKSELGVFSRKIGNVWYWELPIEGVCTEVSEKGHGQDTQDSHGISLAMLTNMTTLHKGVAG
jgi:KaiC/GvpD/RAD55 family RecA-like ATPase